MNVIIVEDEIPAVNRLEKLLQQLDSGIRVIKKLDSVEVAVNFFTNEHAYDLIFMDIQLADGLSFSIFEKVSIAKPIIFITAFDEYAIKAFKVNSIDYLLKPIEEAQLESAIRKYKNLYEGNQSFSIKFEQLLKDLNQQNYKERLLIKRGQQFSYLKISNLAYVFADGKLCYAVDFNGSKFLLENNLSQLEEQLAPNQFYRVNRHLIVNIDAVTKVHSWLGNRLKLDINPTTTIDTIVSRERVADFKEWLGR